MTNVQHRVRDALHFRATVESSNDATIDQSLDGIVTSWNRGAGRLFGSSESEVLGNSISSLVPPALDDELPDILRRVSLGDRSSECESARARKDGTQAEVSLTISPITTSEGTVIDASMIARDITDRVRQEQLRFLAEQDP